jgi:hypothetical protein
MMQPRLIRLRDAPTYLGIDRNRFNAEVRPTLIEIPIGQHGIAFDRLDLDAWVDHYKSCNGRPAQQESVWELKECQVSSNGVIPGTLTKKSTESEFAKALALVNSKKQKNT